MADNPAAGTCASILAGEFDGHLADVLAAIVKRQQSGFSSMRWRLRLDGVEITEDDMTLAEAKTVEKITNLSWVTIEPTRSAVHMSAILVAAAHHRDGLSIEEAEERVDAHSANEIMGALDQYEVNPSPLENGGSSSSTTEPRSSSSESEGSPTTS